MGDPTGRVVDLHSRTGYQPDMGALARGHLARARQQLGLSTAELAEQLGPLLPGYPITPGLITQWEESAVPPGDVLVAVGVLSRTAPIGATSEDATDMLSQVFGQRYADVAAIFTTRSEFNASMPPEELFDGAHTVQAAGLSLNVLCQQLADDRLRDLIERGTLFHCLFLAPGGEAIAVREREEHFPAGHLSTLTEVNIQLLADRVRSNLSAEAQQRLTIATYDEIVRFNITMVDRRVGVIQPYLPSHRGVESPTFVVRRQEGRPGLFPLFDGIFDKLAERSVLL